MDSSPATNPNVFYMEVKTPANEQEPCLTFMPCKTCDTLSACSNEAELNEVAVSNQNLTLYGTKLEYHCDPGRQFLLADSTTSETYTIECNWNETWSVDPTLPNCTCNNRNSVFLLSYTA